MKLFTEKEKVILFVTILLIGIICVLVIIGSTVDLGMKPLMYVLIAFGAGIFAQMLYYLITKEYESIDDKYFLEMRRSLNDSYSILCDEGEFRNIIEWYKSNEQEYMLEIKNSYMRISKYNIVELRYCKINRLRQLIEPMLFVVKSPAKFGVKEYFKFVVLLGALIIGLTLYQGVPLTSLTAREGMGEPLGLTVINITNSVFVVLFIIGAVWKWVEGFSKKTKWGEWATINETRSFKLSSSFLFNGLIILAFNMLILMI